jgi:hypothetical protein
MDEALRAALRDAEAQPGDGGAQGRAVTACARAGVPVSRALALRAADAWPDDDALQVIAAEAHRRDEYPPPMRVLARRPRWRALAAFVARWFVRPLQDHAGTPGVLLDGVTRRLGAMPLALREWYELCGRRPDVQGNVQDRAVEPNELRPDDDGLVPVYLEDQGVLAWGVRATDLALDDPPAFMNENPGPLMPTGEALSVFLHHMVVHQSFSRRGAVVALGGGADQAAIEAIKATWPRLPFGQLSWEVPSVDDAYELQGYYLHGDDEALVEVDTYGHVRLQARDQATLERVRALLPSIDWPPF